MKIYICEDDKKDLDRLRELINRYYLDRQMNAVVTEFYTGEDLLVALKNGNHADIFFLDINLPDIDGLKVAASIRDMMDEVPIVLVTAFMNYALDGYKVKASRFLIKDDLDKTFEECMDHICGEIIKKSKIIVLPCVEGEVRLKASEIVLVETSGHKSIIRLKDRKYQIYEKLENLEIQLKEYGFLRIHKSFLVNMAFIRSINCYIMTLTDGKQLSVPKARYKQVRQEYALFVGKEL